MMVDLPSLRSSLMQPTAHQSNSTELPILVSTGEIVLVFVCGIESTRNREDRWTD